MFYSGTACLRGLQSTTPATTNEPEASEVLHPTRNHHHVPNHRSNFTKQPKKMISKTASHFDQRFRNAQTCHVDQKMSGVLHLSRTTRYQTSKCPESPTPADTAWTLLKKQARRAGKTRALEEWSANSVAGEAFCEM